MDMIYADKTHKSYEVLLPKLDKEKKEYGQKQKRDSLVEGEKNGERNKTIDMAEKMLAKKRPIDEIIEFTRLTIKDIFELKGGVDYLMGVAKSMLADGLDISKVAKYTGLTVEAIKNIKADMSK